MSDREWTPPLPPPLSHHSPTPNPQHEQQPQRPRYSSEDDRDIQAQLNEFDLKYHTTNAGDNDGRVANMMPVVVGRNDQYGSDAGEYQYDGRGYDDGRDGGKLGYGDGVRGYQTRGSAGYGGRHADGGEEEEDGLRARRVEEIQLDELELELPLGYGDDRYSGRGRSSLGMQQSRKTAQMNNPLAALVLSMDTEAPVVPEEEEIEDIDKLIELSHNRDRRRGQSSVGGGGGIQAINQLLEGYVSPTMSGSPDNRKEEGFWHESITVQAEPEENKRVETEWWFDRAPEVKPEEKPKEDAATSKRLVSSILGVVGKPLSLIKSRIIGNKEDDSSEDKDHMITPQPVIKPMSIDELMSKQRSEETHVVPLEITKVTDEPAKVIEETKEIIALLKPRVMAFDDTWVTEIKAYLKQHGEDHLTVKIDKERVTSSANNKLLGIWDTSDSHEKIHTRDTARVTTSAVLRLDQVTSDPVISNSVSLVLQNAKPPSIEITPYRVLLDSFDSIEKQRLKESKVKRQVLLSKKQQKVSNRLFSIRSIPSLTHKCTAIRAENSHNTIHGEVNTAIRNATKAGLVSLAQSRDHPVSLCVVSTTDGEVIEVDLKKHKTHKDKYPGVVRGLDLSLNSTYWAGALQTGELVVRKTYGSWTQKKIKVDEFNAGTSSHKKSDNSAVIKFISNDTLFVALDTMLWKVVVNDLKVMLDLTRLQAWRCPQTELEICDLRPIHFKGGWHVAVSTLPGTLRLFSCGQTLQEVAKLDKPEGAEADTIPQLGILETDDLPYTLGVAFWEDKVILVKIEGATTSIISTHKLKDKRFILEGNILRGYIICMILDDYSLRVESIESLFGLRCDLNPTSVCSGNIVISGASGNQDAQTLQVWGGLYNNLQLSRGDFSKPREVGFRFDGSQTVSFGGICKVSNNDLLLLGPDKLTTIKVLSACDIASAYAECGMWLSAFKICVFYITDVIHLPKSEVQAVNTFMTELSNSLAMRKPSSLVNEPEEEWNDQKIIDRTAKIEHQVAKICVEALMVSGNSEFLLGQFRLKTDEFVMWQVLDSFIQAGQVEGIPVEAFPTALKYLSEDSAEFLIFQAQRQALTPHIDKFKEIMKILWHRKLWNCVYRLGLVVFEDTLYSIWNTLLSDSKETLLVEGHSQLSKYVDAALSFDKDLVPQIWQEDRAVEDYLRLVWLLKTLCAWDVSYIIEDTSRVEITLNYVIAWMILPQNLKVMDTLQLNVYLDILFDLFTNVDFSSNGKAFELIRRNVEPFKTKLLATIGPVNGKPSIQIPEGNDGLKLKLFLMFKILEEIFFEHCNTSHRVEISYFAMELILLSIFGKFPFQDAHFIQNLIVNLLSEPFTKGRLWHRFIVIGKEEFEEKVTKFVTRLQEHQAFDSCKEALLWLASKNKHLRVYGYLLETTKGPVEALPVYIELSHETQNAASNLFIWMKKKLAELSSKPAQKMEMAKQIFRNIDSIVVC